MHWVMGNKKARLILDCDPDRKKMKMQIYTLDLEKGQGD